MRSAEADRRRWLIVAIRRRRGSGRHWLPSIAVVASLAPVLLGLGGWMLAKSNQQAVVASTVSDLAGEVKELQDQLNRMELRQAEGCPK